MKKIYEIFATSLLFVLFSTLLSASGDKVLVKISDKTSYFYVDQRGQRVKVGRIQDTDNRLTDDFTKTSRTCPPYCIQPIVAEKGVETIGELELIEAVKNPNTLLVDARPKEWFMLESLPGAVNIPEKLTRSKKSKPKLFKALKERGLIIYGNGLWSPEAVDFIKNIIRLGYPASKLRYYRGGLQGWKILGMTTVIHAKQQVKQ